MLDDRELDLGEAQLRSMKVAASKHFDELQQLLAKHEELIEAYRLLKSDYEKEKVSREKYKRLARSQPQSSVVEQPPFVLLLVDGDHYIVCSSCVCLYRC